MNKDRGQSSSGYLDSIVKNVATDKNLSSDCVDYENCTTDTNDITSDSDPDFDPYKMGDYSYIIKHMFKYLHEIAEDADFNHSLITNAGKHNAVRVEGMYKVISRNINKQQNYMMDDQDDIFIEKTIYRKLKGRRIIDDVAWRIGCKATIHLALIAGFEGGNVDSETRDIVVHCAGSWFTGSKCLIQLANRRVITFGDIDFKENLQYSLSEILGAIPGVLMLYIRTRRRLSYSVDGIFTGAIATSLPVELQYIHAGNLPLSKKLRTAHLDFAVEYYHQILKKPFNPSTYTFQMQQSKEYENHHLCLTVLDELDKSHQPADSGRKIRTFETIAKRYSREY